MCNQLSRFRVTSLVLCATLGVVACQREKIEPATDTRSAASAKPSADAVPQEAGSPRESASSKITLAGVGSCESAPELSQTLTRIGRAADADGNGQIEKEEAYSAADFLVGGFFFYADQDGNGSVSPAEGRKARQQMLDRHPLVAAALNHGSAPKSALRRMADLLSIHYNEPLTSAEMRTAGHRLVDEIFTIADQNRDGSLTWGELEQTARQRARSIGQSVFEQSDKDDDRALTLEEFRSALDSPTRLAFDSSDTNHDGKLTADEAAMAVQALVRRVWLPALAASKQLPLSTTH